MTNNSTGQSRTGELVPGNDKASGAAGFIGYVIQNSLQADYSPPDPAVSILAVLLEHGQAQAEIHLAIDGESYRCTATMRLERV